jgi:hypothetical protein
MTLTVFRSSAHTVIINQFDLYIYLFASCVCATFFFISSSFFDRLVVCMYVCMYRGGNNSDDGFFLSFAAGLETFGCTTQLKRDDDDDDALVSVARLGKTLKNLLC